MRIVDNVESKEINIFEIIYNINTRTKNIIVDIWKNDPVVEKIRNFTASTVKTCHGLFKLAMRTYNYIGGFPVFSIPLGVIRLLFLPILTSIGILLCSDKKKVIKWTIKKCVEGLAEITSIKAIYCTIAWHNLTNDLNAEETFNSAKYKKNYNNLTNNGKTPLLYWADGLKPMYYLYEQPECENNININE